MFAIIGIVVVFAAVFRGCYLLERGNPYVLMQPAELLIVGGAAAGIILVANPPAVIRKMCSGVAAVFGTPAAYAGIVLCAISSRCSKYLCTARGPAS